MYPGDDLSAPSSPATARSDCSITPLTPSPSPVTPHAFTHILSSFYTYRAPKATSTSHCYLRFISTFRPQTSTPIKTPSCGKDTHVGTKPQQDQGRRAETECRDVHEKQLLFSKPKPIILCCFNSETLVITGIKEALVTIPPMLPWQTEMRAHFKIIYSAIVMFAVIKQLESKEVVQDPNAPLPLTFFYSEGGGQTQDGVPILRSRGDRLRDHLQWLRVQFHAGLGGHTHDEVRVGVYHPHVPSCHFLSMQIFFSPIRTGAGRAATPGWPIRRARRACC